MKNSKFLLVVIWLVPFTSYSQWGSNGSDIYYNNGKVGVGIQSPSQLLHVYGDGGIIIDRNHSNYTSYIRLDKQGVQKWILHGGTNTDDKFSIARYYNGAYRYSDFVIDFTGKVGINTSSPRYLLDIKTYSQYEGNNHYFGDRRYYLAGVTGTGAQMYGGFILNNLGSGKRAFEVVVDSHNDFDNSKSPANYVASFLSNGNVGIGERDPKYRLTVEGVISASEVKVSATPNSDYVFEPDYPLLPLSEVEAHIKEKKHLPGVPSAEEFRQNGVGLGEMDDMLLRKVEELVLYTIEQQKELERLREENEALRKEKTADIHRLLKRIELLETRQQ